MEGIFKVHSSNIIPYYNEAKTSLEEIHADYHYFRHVPRHENWMADSLANEAIDDWSTNFFDTEFWIELLLELVTFELNYWIWIWWFFLFLAKHVGRGNERPHWAVENSNWEQSSKKHFIVQVVGEEFEFHQWGITFLDLLELT